MPRRRRFTAADLGLSPDETLRRASATLEVDRLHGEWRNRLPREVWVPCIPAPWARPRWNGKTRTGYTSESAREGAKRQGYYLANQGPYEPYTIPLKLTLQYVMPLPKKAKQRGPRPHAKRPDLDNLCKLTIDCLTRLGWWKDDSQVCELVASKRYGSEPGVLVRLEAA